jgi:hypothetical protein
LGDEYPFTSIYQLFWHDILEIYMMYLIFGKAICPHRLNDVFLASRAPGTTRDPEAGQELQY